MRRLPVVLALTVALSASPALAGDAGWTKHRDHYVRWAIRLAPPTEESRPADVERYLASRRAAIRRAKRANDRYRAWRIERARVQERAERSMDPDGPRPAPSPSGGVNWLAIADCESGNGDGQPPYTASWSYNGLYDGGLQFSPSTWLAAGGGQYAPYAYLATPAEQIATAARWASLTGCIWCPSGWPGCGRYA